ncbi:hypothetical protein LI82_10940 [Methanococcoides methylutens]|uniref:HhH-GPD domain-containing protein n=1 Tax=Methanococcoides methylutens TaxID=2226 RepID=A0A099SZB6_METMT|nr:hypothetical protein [Methanococcoides methylutens]KGK98227.1 hypothetical protein LI82_10940 [Methanococcoides methylutens]
MNYELLQKYNFAKTIVIDQGFHDEISWQAKISFEDLDERTFLREFSWVVLSSGMKNTVIEKKFDPISNCFYEWESASLIAKNCTQCLKSAIKIFNNKAKMSAIIDAASRINKEGFSKIKKLIEKDPIKFLQEFKFIGPITVYHLAKNIGLDFAKPDRHLQRIASMHNYSDVQSFCRDISKHIGDSVPVVDIVYWRFATIEPDYLNVLSSLNIDTNTLLKH